MPQTIDQVWRDYDVAGVPASGNHNPKKSEIRTLLKGIQGGTDSVAVAVTAESDRARAAETAIGIRINDVEALAATGVRSPKASVRLLVTVNVNIANALEAGDTVDGIVLVVGDRVALTGQTVASQNGVHIVQAAGSAIRATDMDTGDELVGAYFTVDAGTHAGETWALTNTGTITVGTTALSFVKSATAVPYADKVQALTTAAEDQYLVSLGWYVGEGSDPDSAPSRVTENNLVIPESDASSAVSGSAAEYFVTGNELHGLGAPEDKVADLGGLTVLHAESFGADAVRAIINRPMINDTRTVRGEIGSGLMVPDSKNVLHVIIGLGQSLMSGHGSATTLVTTTQPYPEDALMADIGANSNVWVGVSPTGAGDGVLIDPDAIVGFTPMIAKSFPGSMVVGETPLEGFTTRLAHEARQLGIQHRMCGFIAARGGQAYAALKRGTYIWTNMLTALERLRDLAALEGWTVVVDGCLHIHGALDDPAYYTILLEWQANVDEDIKAITGQDMPVNFFMVQRASRSSSQPLTSSVQPMLDAANNLPYFHIATAAYVARDHYVSSDYEHFRGPGSERFGEYMALAWRDAFWRGPTRKVVQMKGAVRSGTTVTLTYDVPVPPLVFDTTIIPERDVKGFTYRDSTGAIGITSASITNTGTGTGVGTIVLELATTPSGTSEFVEYAASPQTSPKTTAADQRGNVRDSRPDLSLVDDFPLYNWGVIQQLAVPTF
ncbi:hypothetical protein [Devosia sp. 2618]|uniref:hypothetical protein n=1 Tax=Devosia sp. 2618 TaxID=3156454 RepID=UPI00339AD51C